MGLQTSGQISLSQVNSELGNSASAQISLGGSAVRGLFGRASGSVSMSHGYGASNGTWLGSRGLFAGGAASGGMWWQPPTYMTAIHYITIASASNSSSFGNLSQARSSMSGASDGSRGVFSGGNNGGATSLMDYVTVASTGNASSFGNHIESFTNSGACSNGARGVFAQSVGAGGGGMMGPPPAAAIMEYITIASTGNATSFGTTILSDSSGGSGCSDGTRGLLAGSGLQYITIASTGNATNFGNAQGSNTQYTAAISGGSRGVMARAVYSGPSLIDYVNISSTGNATRFGDLISYRQGQSAVSNDVRGVFGPGDSSNGYVQIFMDYITIASTGNAVLFGHYSPTSSMVATGGLSGA